MSQEAVFRVIAIVLFISAISISVYYRRRADRSGEQVSTSEEGWVIFLLLRLFGLSLFAGVILYIVYPPWLSWSMASVPLWLRWCGVAVGVVSVPLLYWIFSSLGMNVTRTVVTRKEHTLITHGPYRWVRHPLYTVALFTWLGFALMSTSWWIAVTSVLGFVVISARTRIEERKLIERFGDDYREYMKRTGRFLPRLGQ